MRAARAAAGGLAFLAIVGVGCGRQEPANGRTMPAVPAVYTACGHVTDLAVAEDGCVWAATKGGVLRWRSGDPTPKLWTAADGLKSNEVQSVTLAQGGIIAAGVTGANLITASGEVTPAPADSGMGARWAVESGKLRELRGGRVYPAPDDAGTITAFAVSEDRAWLASALGFWRLDSGRWSKAALPSGSPASHVSALALDRNRLVAALYGDGLYTLDGSRWTRLAGTPEALDQVTALASGPNGLIAGTQSGGVWDRTGGRWKQRAMPPSLPDADIYAVASYNGAIYASTFDQGLLRFQGGKWARLTRAHGLSSDSPRDLVVFNDILFIRHTTGQVDRLKNGVFGRAFSKADLPREAYAMSTDGSKLYLGTWAGWASTDGSTWEHHFREAGLQGQVVTAVRADSGTVWIGTAKAGLFEWRGGKLTHYHESSGLTDDWITSIADARGRLLVGTYSGGLLEYTGHAFRKLTDAGGFPVRAIRFLQQTGTVLIATPSGTYCEKQGKWLLVDPSLCGGLEAQALYPDDAGVWVGGRTSLAFLPYDRL